MGYFSQGFLLVRAHDAGFSASQIVLLYALYGTINLALVFASSQWEIIAIFALYGLFYAVEESQSKALIADLEHYRWASAMGVYNFVTGVLYLPASLIAGALWTVAPALAFGLAALLSLVAMGVFTVLRPSPPR